MAFHYFKGFSENVAHVCVCLHCANGEAFLRGMQQAAFLKAIGKFLPTWESSALSQADDELRPRLNAKEVCPLIDFSSVRHGKG